MKLNERLAELRKAKGLTQQDLAEALNVSRQAVSRWEVGTAGGTRFNNADGTYDVLAWADMMNTYRNIDTESWQGCHGALYDALDQVRSARESAK